MVTNSHYRSNKMLCVLQVNLPGGQLVVDFSDNTWMHHYKTSAISGCPACLSASHTLLSLALRFVCKNNGVLFENQLLQIGIKSEYRQNLGESQHLLTCNCIIYRFMSADFWTLSLSLLYFNLCLWETSFSVRIWTVLAVFILLF